MCSSPYSFQQVCDILRANFPEIRHNIPEGTPGAPLPPVYRIDNSKAERELGMSFMPLEKTMVDGVNSYLEIAGSQSASMVNGRL